MSPRANGILFVTNSLAPGGAEHALIELARGVLRWSNDRFRPVVACYHSRGNEASQLSNLGVPVYEHLLGRKYDPGVIGRLARLMRDQRIAVVVPTGSGGDRMFWATLAAQIVAAKVVVWSHIYPQNGFPGFEKRNRVLYRFVDRFVALGQRHRAALAWQEHVPLGKIEVIVNGVDIQRYHRPQLRERARAVLGLADEEVFAVAMIGTLRPSKRHDVFIKAARELVQQRRNVHFFVIGDGPNRNLVQTWAKVSGLLGKNLSLLSQRHDVDQLLPGLDLLCICSEYEECLSLAALEAMAAGVPVLSNRIGSMDEAIIDGRTGFFYDSLTPRALAAKIDALMQDRGQLATVARNAYRLANDKFTTRRMTEQFCRLWDNLLVRG